MRTIALAALLAVSCKDDSKGQQPVDTGADVEPEPDPEPLQAGFARARIPAPVGMGTRISRSGSSQKRMVPPSSLATIRVRPSGENRKREGPSPSGILVNTSPVS